MLLLIWTNIKLPAFPCTQIQAHGGECLHKEVTLSTRCSKRKGLVFLPQQERQELVLLTPALCTKHTHALRRDPSQTAGVARPSMVLNSLRTVYGQMSPTFTQTPLSCFFHQQPQNQLLFPTPCFMFPTPCSLLIREYCSTDIREVYLNLTASRNKESGKLAGDIKLS